MKPINVEYAAGQDVTEFAEELAVTLRRNKLVTTTGVDPDGDPRSFWDEVSDTVGDCVLLAEDAQSNQKLGLKWMEIRYDPSIKDAYRHSNIAQPLHTDCSYISEAPELIFFYCLRQARAGGATTFLDSAELVALLEAEQPAMLDDLRSTPITFSKVGDSKRRSVISEDARGTVLTWNYHCVDENETAHAKELANRFHRWLHDRVVAEALTTPVRLQPGHAVFFADERLLHGRNAFDADGTNERFFWKTGFTLRQPAHA